MSTSVLSQRLGELREARLVEKNGRRRLRADRVRRPPPRPPRRDRRLDAGVVANGPRRGVRRASDRAECPVAPPGNPAAWDATTTHGSRSPHSPASPRWPARAWARAARSCSPSAVRRAGSRDRIDRAPGDDARAPERARDAAGAGIPRPLAGGLTLPRLGPRWVAVTSGTSVDDGDTRGRGRGVYWWAPKSAVKVAPWVVLVGGRC